MCIVLMQLNHPDFALIIANNRDEFLLRPTAPSHWHSFPHPTEFEPISEKTPSLSRYKANSEIDSKGALKGTPSFSPSVQRPILSGIDVHLSGGGTWIGITRKGKLAVLTNFTEQSPPPLPKDRGLETYRSRGKLPKDWLLSDHEEGKDQWKGLDNYLTGIENRKDEWPGFNLLAGQVCTDSDKVYAKIGYVSNRTKEGEGVTFLPGQDTVGVACDGDGQATNNDCCSVGLSNSTLQEPWTKVVQGRQLFEEAVKKYDERKQQDKKGATDKLAKDLFDVLATSPGKFEDPSDLPKSICVQPRLRHPKLGWYATRTATVILVGRKANKVEDQLTSSLQWWERDIHIIDENGEIQRSDTKAERHYDANLILPQLQ